MSQPSSQPSSEPTSHPSSQPTALPTGQPSSQPTSTPTGQPSSQPTCQPSTQPTSYPTSNPTLLAAVTRVYENGTSFSLSNRGIHFVDEHTFHHLGHVDRRTFLSAYVWDTGPM